MKRLLSLFLLLLASFSAEAAITFIAADSTRAAADTSRTPAEPTGTTQDDVMYATGYIDSEDGTWSCASGWTEIHNATWTSVSGHDVWCYIVRGASPASMTFSYSGTAADIRITVYTFRGVDTTTPLDVTFSAGSHYQQLVDDQDGPNLPITTVTNGAVVVLTETSEFSAGGTPGAPSGYTLDSTGHGTQPQQNMAYKEVATAGVETPGAWTHTSFNGGDDPTYMTIALRPASTGVDASLLVTD